MRGDRTSGRAAGKAPSVLAADGTDSLITHFEDTSATELGVCTGAGAPAGAVSSGRRGDPVGATPRSWGMGGRVRRGRGRSLRIGTFDNPSPPTATATVAVVAPVAWKLWAIRTAEAASALAPWAIYGCGAV